MYVCLTACLTIHESNQYLNILEHIHIFIPWSYILITLCPQVASAITPVPGGVGPMTISFSRQRLTGYVKGPVVGHKVML